MSVEVGNNLLPWPFEIKKEADRAGVEHAEITPEMRNAVINVLPSQWKQAMKEGKAKDILRGWSAKKGRYQFSIGPKSTSFDYDSMELAFSALLVELEAFTDMVDQNEANDIEKMVKQSKGKLGDLLGGFNEYNTGSSDKKMAA